MNVQDLRFSQWFYRIQVFGDMMLWGKWFPVFWSNGRNHPPMPEHHIPQTIKPHTQTWQQTKKLVLQMGIQPYPFSQKSELKLWINHSCGGVRGDYPTMWLRKLYNSTSPMNSPNLHRHIITFKPLAGLLVFSTSQDTLYFLNICVFS
jgi:hypothetical protein